MPTLFLLASTSFLLALVLTPVCRNLFFRLGLVDRPDRCRKLHSGPVPRAGGIPIFASLLASLALACFIVPGDGSAGPALVAEILRPVPALLVMFATGLLDDIRGLRPWQKLAGQVAAALLAVCAGIRILGIHGYLLPPWACVVATFFWLIGCTNAFNLIDGVDGLAAGVGLFATLTTFMAALLHGDLALAVATAPLAGALLGFLRYNFNPASIFLGDCGSLSVGFLLGCYSVIWSHKCATLLGMTAPLIALSVPLLDTSLTIIRRVLRGQSVFLADRGHIHHRLIDRGLTPRRVVLLLYGACGLAAGLSLLGTLLQGRLTGLIIILFCAGAWLGVQHLGYVEFGIARQMLSDGAFQRTLNANLQLCDLRQAIRRASSPEDCWQAMRCCYREFGFCRVSARLAGRTYTEESDCAASIGAWTVLIPLPHRDFVQFSRDFKSEPEPVAVVPFADVVGKELKSKLELLAHTDAEEPSYAARGTNLPG